MLFGAVSLDCEQSLLPAKRSIEGVRFYGSFFAISSNNSGMYVKIAYDLMEIFRWGTVSDLH
jgi:hypothetical protein